MILAVDMNLYCAALLLEISKSRRDTVETKISPDFSPFTSNSNSYSDDTNPASADDPGGGHEPVLRGAAPGDSGAPPPLLLAAYVSIYLREYVYIYIYMYIYV